ncbi:DUF4129 domain-containing protein [bacterium]|nr:DUF4129 domain-containing protein [bacterium]
MRLLCILGLLVLLGGTSVHAQDDGAGWIDQGEELAEDVAEQAQGDLAEQAFETHSYDPEYIQQDLRGLVDRQPRPAAGEDSSLLLRSILSSEDFLQSEAPETQADGVMQKVFNWLDNTLKRMSRSLGLNFAGGGVVTYVLVVLALALVAVLIRQLIMNAGPRSERGRKRNELDPELDPEVDLVRLAEQHARDGDFRLATRYRFLAVLRSLDMPASALTTNSMLVRQVRREHPTLQAEFSELVRLFEDAWYGSLDCDRPHYSAAASLAGLLDQRIRIRDEERK